MSADSTFPAYGVTTPGLDIQQLTIKQRALKDTELLLQVLYCGVCASDIHQMQATWSGLGLNIVQGNNELVCGHEAISVVIGKGSKTSDEFQIGDIVGCGPQRDCKCNQLKDSEPICTLCEENQEQLCLKGIEKLYSRDFTGGFGSILQCCDKFCFKIPQGMDLLKTAPLCCAGLTTYAPLERASHTLPENATIGVIGIGGLGLMTLMYALKMAPIKDVYAFTSSKASKEATLLELGCTGVIDYNNEDLSQYKNKFDLIINTVSQDIDVNKFLTMVKPFGEVCYLGLGPNNISLNPFSIIGNKRVTGSFIGGTTTFKKMLEFSHQHNIYPICETVQVPFQIDNNNADVVAKAIQRVEKGDVRYRMVLDYQVNVDEVVKKALEAAKAQ